MGRTVAHSRDYIQHPAVPRSACLPAATEAESDPASRGLDCTTTAGVPTLPQTCSLQAVLNRFIPLTTTVRESASDTYTLTQLKLKGTIDRYSSKTVVV